MEGRTNRGAERKAIAIVCEINIAAIFTSLNAMLSKSLLDSGSQEADTERGFCPNIVICK